MEIHYRDKYTGVDYTDNIKHHRYIKREMKNGRWVYYYNMSELKNQNKAIKETIKYDKNMIKNNTTYNSPYDGKKYGPDHYKKALKYDTIDLIKNRVKMKSIKMTTKSLNEISKYRAIGKKKINKILNELNNKRG